LQDTDVAGYLRIAHEQNLISTIEEGRKETQEEFYRVLEDRSQRDWEAKKKRVFEELGGRIGTSDRRVGPLGKSSLSVSTLHICHILRISLPWIQASVVGPSLSLQMQTKMMAYDRVITELNNARLRGTSYPLVHALIDASRSIASDVSFSIHSNISCTKFSYSRAPSK
jgi:nuclear pore complex protein Nup93